MWKLKKSMTQLSRADNGTLEQPLCCTTGYRKRVEHSSQQKKKKKKKVGSEALGLGPFVMGIAMLAAKHTHIHTTVQIRGDLDGETKTMSSLV